MYTIILVSCLVLSVAEGHSDDGKAKNDSDLTREFIEQTISEISLNHDNKLQIVENSLENLIKLNEKLSTIPDEECQNKLEDPLDLKKHCFHPNVPICKSTMRDCFAEARNHIRVLLIAALKTHYYFKHFIPRYAQKYIVHCQSIYDISTSNYKKCVNDTISLEKDTVNENKKKFYDQMDTAVNASKKYEKELEISLLAFKSKSYPVLRTQLLNLHYD